MSESYIMRPVTYRSFNYIYYERKKNQCPICEYGTYNKPLTKKGEGFYECSQHEQTRLNIHCLKFKQKGVNEEEINEKKEAFINEWLTETMKRLREQDQSPTWDNNRNDQDSV